jgi:uncharacterized protein
MVKGTMPDRGEFPETELLRKAGCPENVIRHAEAVTRLALRIAAEVRINLDTSLIRKGALLHDIGRSRTHGIAHALEGVRIAREMGLDGPVIGIIRNHIGAGISRDEARVLGLPEDDYMPATPEEKIVACADNLIMGEQEVSFETALERFREMLGEGHPAVERFIRLHEEIEGWKAE